MATAASTMKKAVPVTRHVSNFLYRYPWVALILMFIPPLIWFGVVYLGSLGAMLIQSLYRYDGFTGLVIEEYSLDTYRELTTDANVDVVRRTVFMASAVTVACAILAFPLAYYMARYARGYMRGALYLAVMLPLWSSYLVRVYSWKLILAKDGIISWFTTKFGLEGVLDWILARPGIGGPSLSFSYIGLWIVFVYIWIPYMILPINASLERVPKSLLEASSDLGARPWYTFWRVTLPLTFPGVVAGSIFTFSLTLGDFLIPRIIGNSTFFIGSVVYLHQGTAGNFPLAAAFTAVPVAIMIVYLLVAKKLGAFDAL